MGNLVHHKELQQKGDGGHDVQLVERQQESLPVDAAGVQGDIVHDHAIDHEDGHDGGKDDVLQFGFGHTMNSSWNDNPVLGALCVVRYHSRECALPIVTIRADWIL